MIGSELIRRTIAHALMWSHVVIKVDPVLRCPEKVSQGSIAPALRNRQLKGPNKAFGMPVVRWGPRSAHRADEALL